MRRMTYCVILVALAVMPAAAGTDTFNVQCLGWSGTGAGDLGDTGPDTTSTSPSLQAPVGIATTDLEAFQCFFVVPDDYTGSGAKPTITFQGWVPEASICGISGSCLARDLAFDIKSRDFADGDLTSNAWSSGGSTSTRVITNSTCGMNECWDADKIYVFSGDATNSVADWTAGQMAVIWVQRWDDLERYKGKFFVNAVAQIEYTN